MFVDVHTVKCSKLQKIVTITKSHLFPENVLKKFLIFIFARETCIFLLNHLHAETQEHFVLSFLSIPHSIPQFEFCALQCRTGSTL